MILVVFGYVMFGDLSRVWLCHVGPLVWLAMLCRPFGDLSHVWLCYVGPLVTIAMFGYVIGPLVTLAVFGYVDPLVTLVPYVMYALW